MKTKSHHYAVLAAAFILFVLVFAVSLRAQTTEVQSLPFTIDTIKKLPPTVTQLPAESTGTTLAVGSITGSVTGVLPHTVVHSTCHPSRHSTLMLGGNNPITLQERFVQFTNEGMTLATIRYYRKSISDSVGTLRMETTVEPVVVKRGDKWVTIIMEEPK